MKKTPKIQNVFMKILFIINLYLFISINSHLILPLKYYPIYKYNYTNPSEIMKTIVSSKLYAIIEVGTPKKQIEIPLDFETNEFFISNDPKYEFEQNNLFSDLKFYSDKESSSLITDGDMGYTGDKFDLAELATESFFFDNKKYELQFYFPYTLKNVESGGIGLLLQPRYHGNTDNEKTLFKQLKAKDFIKNYYWSIFFNTKNIEKESEGFILLGSLPHELETDLGYYKKKYFQKEYKNVNAEMSGTDVLNRFKIDQITVYQGTDKKKILDNFPVDNINMRLIELDYHSNGVQAPYELFGIYKAIFLNNSNGECFMGEFNYVQKKVFFYCNNKKNIIKKIKSILPGFTFLSRDLVYNFTLDADDLFIEKEGYVFCLLYFHSDQYLYKTWIMGKPFLRKYQFTFNPDLKQYYFYTQEEQDSSDSSGGKVKVNVLIIIIIGTIIIVAVACFLLFKFYLYDLFQRKKRANELDDDFEYTQQKEENSNTNSITPSNNEGIN